MNLRVVPDRPLRVAAGQVSGVELDVAGNAARAATLVRRAAGAGAALLVLPELFLSGYRLDAAGQHTPDRADPRIDVLRAACAETGTTAVVGAPTRAEGATRISALVVGPDGAVLGQYDKQHLDPAELAAGFTPGTRGCTLLLDGWRLGLGICWDASFPEHARAAALDGCQAYLVAALFDVGAGARKQRIIGPARAWDNAGYVVAANHCTRTGPYVGCGGSAIWDPAGDVVADAGLDDPGLAVAQLEPDAVAAARSGDLTHEAPSLDVPRRPRDLLLVR